MVQINGKQTPTQATKTQNGRLLATGIQRPTNTSVPTGSAPDLSQRREVSVRLVVNHTDDQRPTTIKRRSKKRTTEPTTTTGWQNPHNEARKDNPNNSQRVQSRRIRSHTNITGYNLQNTRRSTNYLGLWFCGRTNGNYGNNLQRPSNDNTQPPKRHEKPPKILSEKDSRSREKTPTTKSPIETLRRLHPLPHDDITNRSPTRKYKEMDKRIKTKSDTEQDT